MAAAWENFDGQLVTHHEGEHAIAWPALEAVGLGPEVTATMDAEHEVMAAALGEARIAMAALSRTAGADEALAAFAAVVHRKVVTLRHLDHEEAEIEPFYLAKQDTPEIKAMGKAFGKVSPAKGGQFFAWVLDGASPAERAAVTANVPGPVIAIIGGIFGRSYRKHVATVWTT